MPNVYSKLIEMFPVLNTTSKFLFLKPFFTFFARYRYHVTLLYSVSYFTYSIFRMSACFLRLEFLSILCHLFLEVV